MIKEELKKEAEEYAKKWARNEENEGKAEWACYYNGYLASAEPREKRISELEAANKKISGKCHKLVDSLEKKQNEVAELKELIEKYRQAVDKCLHITFMGGGCEVNTIAQYATLVDGYLIDVEGLAKWKN